MIAMLCYTVHFVSNVNFQAKLAMMGNMRTMILANGMYVPFGALMLVMYDKALHNTLNQIKMKQL